jgi:hypothetical protein
MLTGNTLLLTFSDNIAIFVGIVISELVVILKITESKLTELKYFNSLALKLVKSTKKDTIDTNWTLSFDLTAMNNDKDFKKMLKNGFLDPSQLIIVNI